jgi:hypothetical protein
MPRHEKHTVAKMSEAIVLSDGLVTLAAKRLSMSFQALYKAVKRHPELQRVIDEANEQIVDLAEHSLKKKILSGDIAAIIFTLKTRGKSRGWVERQEIDMRPTRYDIVIPEDADDRGAADGGK